MTLIPHIIAGKPVPGSGGAPVFSAATGERCATVPSGGAVEVEAAVAAAQAAFPGWAATIPARRARVMFEVRRLIEARKDALAHRRSHRDGIQLPGELKALYQK